MVQNEYENDNIIGQGKNTLEGLLENLESKQMKDVTSACQKPGLKMTNWNIL